VTSRIWWCWLVLGTAATGAYFLLPENGLAANLAYNVIGLASGLLILLAVRLHRPVRPGMWYWFGAGQITWVAGDLTYEYYEFVLHRQPYPSAADVFYLCAYPMLIAGLLVLLRGRSRRDLAGLIDAAIVATGLGLVFWVFVIQPIAAESDASAVERTVSVAYPVADALLLALLARLFLSTGRLTRSTRLLMVAALLLLVTDVGFAVLELYASVEEGFLDAGWLLSYVTWAASALHPSMRTAGTAPASGREFRAGRRRTVLLAVSSLLAPALLLVPAIGRHGADRTAIAGCAIILFLLVLLRMSGLVAQVRRQAGQLAELAMHDELTGLANRRRFEHDLGVALAAGRPQVALLDLDGFKEVNDRLGHAVGDELLAVLGGRIRTALRGDALAARMGGDEFAVLVPDATPAQGDAVLDRVAATLRDAISAGGHQLLVRASIGIADGDATDGPMEIIRRADVAMYAAKGDGGAARRRYRPELDEGSTERARVGAELRTALDAGQFRLVYQPIVRLPSGSIASVEALVRWDHPERGLIPPDQFIPAAEANGLIVELGAWILRTACAQLAEWQVDLGEAARMRMSVNVSPRQLAEPGFAALVARTLEEFALPPEHLAVEVTETAVFGGGQAVQAVQDLHDQGVRIALDDFGTGHSSLGLLQTIPVDILKVDKSFVDNVTMTGRHAVIAEALILLAQGLGLAAVAEGVETAEQAAELHRLGYEYAQGYHFGRPVPQPDFGHQPSTAPTDAAISRQPH
jgi:diguanylate cyclase (GGDEF)-like protein